MQVVWIGQIIVTQFACFPRVNANLVEYVNKHVEYSVGGIPVADCCHRRVTEKLFNSCSMQVVVDAPGP